MVRSRHTHLEFGQTHANAWSSKLSWLRSPATNTKKLPIIGGFFSFFALEPTRRCGETVKRRGESVREMTGD
jgi:hypothetical protein